MNIYYTKLGKFQAHTYNRKKMGELHREDGPAIEYSNGHRFWYQNNKKHRLDGPAIEYSSAFGSGHHFWFKNDMLHRINGPAITFADGTCEYWINNKSYSKEEFDKIAQFYQEDLTILL